MVFPNVQMCKLGTFGATEIYFQFHNGMSWKEHLLEVKGTAPPPDLE